jgi:DNA-binding CsgD family transcriptional regulator
MYIRNDDLRRIARLWHELAEIPAARGDEALTHCFAQLAQIIGAGNVFMVAAARENPSPEPFDRMRGWRAYTVRRLHRDDARDRAVASTMRHFKANAVDPLTEALVARIGTTRALLRREAVDDATWERSWMVNEVMRPIGVEHRLIGAQTVDAGRESCIGIDRGPGERPFGERERDLLHLFLLGGLGFHRELLLAHAPTRPRLTAREQAVLRLLLTELSEREIGAALGLTPRTTHQYVVAVLKKFAVKGRVGLMAHWLRYYRDDAP